MSNLSFAIPLYMDKNYFQNILRQFQNDPNLVLTNFELKRASKAGDGFASTIFRVICSYLKNSSTCQRSLIVKTVPIEDGLKKEMFNHDRAYATEIKMYKEVLPEMEILLRKGLGEQIKIGPELIFSSLIPSPVLILEDLVEIGCQMSDKTFGYSESLKVLQRLAQFHAVSIVINERRMDLTDIKNSFFHINKGKDYNMAVNRMKPSIEMFVEAVMKRGDYHPKVVERLKYFCEHFEELMEQVYVSTANKNYFVLTHNDYHRKNMLFKMPHGKVEEFYLFDYQFCLWSTPVIDLYYFLYQVASTEARQQQRDDLLVNYFHFYNETLKAFNCQSPLIIPSLEELQAEIRRHKAAEVNQIINFFKYQFMTWTDADLIKITGDPMRQTRAVYASNDFHHAVKIDLDRILLNEGF